MTLILMTLSTGVLAQPSPGFTPEVDGVLHQSFNCSSLNQERFDVETRLDNAGSKYLKLAPAGAKLSIRFLPGTYQLKLLSDDLQTYEIFIEEENLTLKCETTSVPSPHPSLSVSN